MTDIQIDGNLEQMIMYFLLYMYMRLSGNIPFSNQIKSITNQIPEVVTDFLPTSSVWGFLLLHFLTNTTGVSYFKVCQWGGSGVIIFDILVYSFLATKEI